MQEYEPKNVMERDNGKCMIGKQRKRAFVSQSCLTAFHSTSSSQVMLHFNTVVGRNFQILYIALNNIQDTKLSKSARSDSRHDSKKNQFCFNNCPYMFPFILNASRATVIHFSNSTCS